MAKIGSPPHWVPNRRPTTSTWQPDYPTLAPAESVMPLAKDNAQRTHIMARCCGTRHRLAGRRPAGHSARYDADTLHPRLQGKPSRQVHFEFQASSDLTAGTRARRDSRRASASGVEPDTPAGTSALEPGGQTLHRQSDPQPSPPLIARRCAFPPTFVRSTGSPRLERHVSQ